MGLINASKKSSLPASSKIKNTAKFIVITALFSFVIAAIAYMFNSTKIEHAPAKESIQLNTSQYSEEQKESMLFIKYAFGKFQTDVRPAYEDLLSYGRNYVGLTNNQYNTYSNLLNNYRKDLLQYENHYPEQVLALNDVTSNILVFAEKLQIEKDWFKHLDLINSINNDISQLNTPLIKLLHTNQLDYQIVQQNDLNIVKF
ncbi:hypothetical protein ACQKNX_22985 [Lysinibacillus sp. NPDC093712]|uniref:hypothetical protein n=1 Tax=Lysinibacillus sp. NPDC093712 TaxID=3390579 RepID=UPI003D022974